MNLQWFSLHLKGNLLQAILLYPERTLQLSRPVCSFHTRHGPVPDPSESLPLTDGVSTPSGRKFVFNDFGCSAGLFFVVMTCFWFGPSATVLLFMSVHCSIPIGRVWSRCSSLGSIHCRFVAVSVYLVAFLCKTSHDHTDWNACSHLGTDNQCTLGSWPIGLGILRVLGFSVWAGPPVDQHILSILQLLCVWVPLSGRMPDTFHYL